MYVELLHKKEQDGLITALYFRVMAEGVSDSPLHLLPDLINLLVQKSLSSYVIQFRLNQYGRFDVEIKSEFPVVKNNLLSMDLEKKVVRMHRFFYGTPKTAIERQAYDDFIHQLLMYKPQYRCFSDALLFGYSVRWHGLLETYQFVNTDSLAPNDFYHDILRQSDQHWIAPAMNHKPCPFDKPSFFKNQVISGFDHFLVCLNYCPVGDSPFHVMIVPYSHTMDFVDMTPAHVFELEALLRATLSLLPGERTSGAIYLQKHAQSGMTVPHMHIHVLYPSTEPLFREDMRQQLQYFAAVIGGDDEAAHALARMLLSDEHMKRQIWRFKASLKQKMVLELSVQKAKYAQLQLNHGIIRFSA